MAKITIIGLGPGDCNLITMGDFYEIKKAKKIYLRTKIHPSVKKLDEENIKYETFDDYYNLFDDFDTLYLEIAKKVILSAKEYGEILYLVPGSPSVAEKTVQLIRNLAKKEDIELIIKPGMSFVEVIYEKLEIDPIDGISIIDAKDAKEKINLDTHLSYIITQVYDKFVASDLKITLMEILPEDYEIIFLRNLSLQDEEIKRIPLYELDHQEKIDHLTSIFLPKYNKKRFQFDTSSLEEIIKILRMPNGCPWDILQTHKSIRKNLIEETYEVLEAIDLENKYLLCEELGDLLMQIVFHARIAEENGLFNMQEVVDNVVEKLIRRHPHVFGNETIDNADDVLENWEKIKKMEKVDRHSILDGVPKDLPALMYAQKIQQKAAKVNFDFGDIYPIIAKIFEEIEEVKIAIKNNDKENLCEEIGDLLFSVVNLARFLKIDAEISLRAANRKFSQRFRKIEEKINEENKDFTHFSIDDLNKMWENIKKP